MTPGSNIINELINSQHLIENEEPTGILVTDNFSVPVPVWLTLTGRIPVISLETNESHI